jgi:hypothetical protein
MASLKWENWLVTSGMKAPKQGSGQESTQQRVKFNVVNYNVVNFGRLFDASANAEIDN